MSSNVNYTYRQISCQRAVQGDNFPLGVQDYNFSVGRPHGWIPSRSYFRIALSLYGPGGVNAPEIKDQVALADSVCGNLFNNVYVRAGGQDVSSIVNYVPQAQACKNRLDRSGAWLKTIGKSAFGCEADFQTRVNSTAADVPASIDGQIQTVKLGADDHQDDYKIVIADTGIITGTNTAFQTRGVVVGDQLLINNATYGVVAVGSNTALTVQPAPNAGVDTGTTGKGVKLKREGDGGGRNRVYLMWQPPVGIWDEAKPMGSGDYRVQLNPNSYYKTAAVELLMKRDAIAAAPTNFNLVVDDIQLFVATVKVDIPTTGVETLHLMEMQLQSKTITSRTGDNMLDFTVPPSTKALTVWVQSADSGTNTQIPPSMFTTKDRSDLNLRSIQLSYANETKPSTRWTSEFKDGAAGDRKNYLQQRYLDTQLYSGKMWDQGGAEAFASWLKRGPMYHMSWLRDQSDRSTHVQLNIQFENLEANANVFLCAHFSRVCEITTQNGFVVSVNSLSA